MLELKGFMFAPFVYILVLTFRLAALSPGWGILEEEMGECIIGLVVLWILLFSPQSTSPFFSGPSNSCFVYCVQSSNCIQCRVRMAWASLSCPEPVPSMLFLNTKFGIVFWASYINLETIGILWTVVSHRLLKRSYIILAEWVYICKYENKMETFQFCGKPVFRLHWALSLAPPPY